MSHRHHLIAVVIACVLILGLGFAFVPKFWAKAVPSYLTEHVPNLKIGHGHFLYNPPRLVLNDIHVLNTKEFGGDDAIRIGQVEVLLADYHHNPMTIRSITVQDVKGKLVMKGARDNFSALYKIMLNKRDEVPIGQMANMATLEHVYFRKVSIQNYDGSILLPIEDTEFEPIDALKKPVTVQYVVTDLLATIARQQAEASPALVVKSTADKVIDSVKSVGESIKNYFNSK